ncbi:MAG: response regulator transcription factor [Spirochaetales bacterium]|jgi:DNA-binding NarL/FixJ family response regulator|nr:response regulator transcription factor [Spirochaetales bacterium]
MNSVIIIEDHVMMRRGLAAYFAESGRWQIAGEAGNFQEAAVLIAGLASRPDMVLLDIELRDGWGLDLVQTLKQKFGKNAPPALVYSVYNDYAHIKAAIRAGAAGYVGKSQGEAELEAAMQAILEGKFYLSPALIPGISAVSDMLLSLTKRERQIFEMVQRRCGNQEIADRLGLNIRTIQNNLSIIYSKTGVKNRRELERL